MSGDWRYILQAIDGSGTPGAILHPDLPLSNVSITQNLSATDELTGGITPYTPEIKSLLNNWGACIWAEASGQIRGGGILVHKEVTGSAISVECMGLHGYAYGMPYTSGTSYNGVEVDPLDVYRLIWAHIQSQPGGNVGLTFPDLKTGLKIGTVLQQVQFDTQEGPVSFEAGPYQLNWWETHDLGQKIDGLASDTPFEFREHRQWDPTHSFVQVSMDLGYPRFNARRTDLRFVVGENVLVPPDTTFAGDEYANELLLLGAGEGRTMIRGRASLPHPGRLRRVVVEEHKDVKSLTAANRRALALLKARLEIGDITDITVMDHEHAPAGSVRPGDEIRLDFDYDWQESESYWVRIQSVTFAPDDGDGYGLSVIRSDKVA